MPAILVVLLVVPLVELYFLIQVGQSIGALPTIALCILTALLGGGLLRQQGFQVLNRARENLDRGEAPALELIEGAALVVGAVMLMIPGFVTDAIGFACLLPFTRKPLVRAVLARMHVSVRGRSRGQPREPDSRRTIEGEFERRDRD